MLSEYVARLESERLVNEAIRTSGAVVPGTSDVAYVSNKDYNVAADKNSQRDEFIAQNRDSNDDANIDQASLGESSAFSLPRS